MAVLQLFQGMSNLRRRLVPQLLQLVEGTTGSKMGTLHIKTILAFKVSKHMT